jgi:hypothetical protein
MDRIAGQQQRVKDMTTHHSTIAKFTKPLSEKFAQRARLAQSNRMLPEIDPCILKDIGMEGFERLSPAQKERALRNSSKHASRN